MKKFGVISIIGSPNAGKSTLLNKLIGEKISIVSSKVQTTRSVIRGIVIKGNAQLVFVDTPGIFKPREKLEKIIVKNAWQNISEADLIIMIIDATKGIKENDELIISNLKKEKISSFVVLNKIDIIQKSKLLDLIAKLDNYKCFKEIFLISALTGEKVPELVDRICEEIPAGQWQFNEDEITDAPLKFIAQEFTREQIFILLSKELPYSIAVETEKWENLPDGITKINQVIYVSKPSHKGIVIGKGGRMLKEIGSRSRKNIENLIGNKVRLELFVKIKENWVDNPDLCV